MSRRQTEDEAVFRQWYPKTADVLAFFAPAKWPGVVEQQGNCLLCPTVTLYRLDAMYARGTATELIINNIVGIFRMAEQRETANTEVIQSTARLFAAKYGKELSAFAALHYFAEYLTEYKSSFGRFDLQDVLRQCGAKFLPWWRGYLGRTEDRRQARQDDTTQRGKTALWTYLRREYRDQGRSIRESDLYYFGYVPERDVAVIENTDNQPAF